MWLEAFLDGGFVGVFLTIGIYVEVYRLFRAAMMSAESNLTAAYMVSLAAGVIGVQSWLIAHSMRFGGDYATMMLVFSAAVVVGMRPGGMFARMPLHDGRIGMEYLGYDPDDHPEDQAEDPTPDNPSIPPFPDAGPLPGIWQGAGNVTR